jgi:hypothetical protein
VAATTTRKLTILAVAIVELCVAVACVVAGTWIGALAQTAPDGAIQ